MVNPKTGFCRKLFLLENDFKTYCQIFNAYRPNKDVKLRPKSLSNRLEQISSIDYQNLFGCAKKNHQEHPQIDKSYIGKIKIYLNDAEPKILL